MRVGKESGEIEICEKSSNKQSINHTDINLASAGGHHHHHHRRRHHCHGGRRRRRGRRGPRQPRADPQAERPASLGGRWTGRDCLKRPDWPLGHSTTWPARRPLAGTAHKSLQSRPAGTHLRPIINIVRRWPGGGVQIATNSPGHSSIDRRPLVREGRETIASASGTARAHPSCWRLRLVAELELEWMPLRTIPTSRQGQSHKSAPEISSTQSSSPSHFQAPRESLQQIDHPPRELLARLERLRKVTTSGAG